MSNMISVASGFQYSVNIGYDLNNDDKLKNFIPTQSALTLLEDMPYRNILCQRYPKLSSPHQILQHSQKL